MHISKSRRAALATLGNSTVAAVCATALLAGAPALAQSGYPAKPIRFIVPYPPGGGTDIVARLVAARMSQSMGQQVIVENKPGASTVIGTDLVAKSAPDGYTFGLVTDSHAINPAFVPKLPYDSAKDFDAVSQFVFVPLVMVANPSLKVSTVQELIAKAKAQPGKINYANAPDMKERFEALGVVGAPSTPDEFAAFMRTQADSLSKLVKLTGVKPD